MSTKTDFTSIQQLIIELAKMQGITLEQMQNSWNAETEDLDWRVDYENDLQERYARKIFILQESIRLHKQAMKEGDLLTARSGLMRASLAAHNLSSFFDALKEDLEKIWLHDSPTFTWPEFPEDYTISEHYDYKGPK